MAANSLGIRLLCFLLLGDVLQDQVSLVHQVFVSSSPGTRWSTWYILCHLWWAEHYPYYWCSQGTQISDRLCSGGRTWRHVWAVCGIFLLGRLWCVRQHLMHCQKYFFQATLLKKKEKRLNLYCVLLWPNFERDNIQILTSVKIYLQKGTVGPI